MTTFSMMSGADVTPFVVATILLALAALALVLAAILMPRRRPERARSGAHRPSSGTAEWMSRIDEVRGRYHGGEITDDDAYRELAALTREFASERLDMDVTNHTLAELRSLRRSKRSATGIDLLRQTVAALYPPEFASDEHLQTRGTTVDQAAGWVANLVERWRSR